MPLVQKYTWPGSNWRPSACEADVIATRPQVPCIPVQLSCHPVGGTMENELVLVLSGLMEPDPVCDSLLAGNLSAASVV